MSSAVFKSDLLMFGDLLAYLREHGFNIGVHHYLRLQDLLNKIGNNCEPQELRTLLCPILATSKTQQEQFYRAFDSYFDLFQVADEPAEAAESFSEDAQTNTPAYKAKSSRRKWIYAATPVALAAVIFALVLFLKSNSIEQPAQTQAKNEATTVTPQETPVQSNEAKLSTPTPIPILVSTPSSKPSFYQRYRIGVHIAIILSPLVLFLLYEWYRFVRRRLLLQRQRARRKPLFTWPIRVDAPNGGLYDSERFLAAARLLRRRQVDEFRRLDVEATVAATIERLGFPDFRYRFDSRVPEYLILIDRATHKDHQARLFDELSQALEREGVFVVRYFFDGDPRVCHDEKGTGVVQLTELQNRFSSYRLLIFGNGEKLLDPITGRLDSWTTIFNHWQERVLLTIESTRRWGLKEIALAQLFIVLPATLKGLLALVDYFETTVPGDLRVWMSGGVSTPPLNQTPEEIVRALHHTLGEETFQWLAACAVYTELQWNLTLYIGSLPFMPLGLVTEANLLKLIRLPWFRTGLIPDEVRWLLINELAPERQKAVRAALIELLEKDPAPLETFAGDQYCLNLSTQRWLQSRTRKHLRELLQLTKQLSRSQVVRDLTLIRFLESASRSPLDFYLPDRLRKVFYHGGVPAFGLKTGVRFLFTLALVAVIWIGDNAFRESLPINSIAVLPFVNVGGDAGTEYLSDGITESLINSLSQLPNLKVIARSSVFRYKGKEIDPQTVGRELDVHAVLTGRVVQIGDQLNIQTELVDVDTQTRLWGENYNRKVSDIIALQDEISREISEKLRLKLTDKEKEQLSKRYTENSQAYQLYWKGRYLWNKRRPEDVREAIRDFQQAIELDANYALAYTGLADCYVLGNLLQVSPREAMPIAIKKTNEALKIDPDLAEAHTSLAKIKLSYEWDWAGAEIEFKKAIALKPGYATAYQWYGIYLSEMGHHDESLEQRKHALDLDPLSLSISTGVGRAYFWARRYDEAIEHLQETLKKDPKYADTHWSFGLAYEGKKMYPEAIASFQNAIGLSKTAEFPEGKPEMIAALGHAYAVSGRRNEALKIIDQLKELISQQSYVSPYSIALIYVGLGEKDQAFEWLDHALDERDESYIHLKVDPRLDDLRSDPRFTERLRLINQF
jgi:TolB-like protein